MSVGAAWHNRIRAAAAVVRRGTRTPYAAEALEPRRLLATVIASNPEPIVFGGGGFPQVPAKYPSDITVAGPAGQTIRKMAITLHGVTYPTPLYLDVVLEGPGGRYTMVMADCGGSNPVNDLTLT